jgi:hypothetical protein
MYSGHRYLSPRCGKDAKNSSYFTFSLNIWNILAVIEANVSRLEAH